MSVFKKLQRLESNGNSEAQNLYQILMTPTYSGKNYQRRDMDENMEVINFLFIDYWKPESYRREAQYYLKQAESHQREASYYTRKDDTDRAQDYTRRATHAMDSYKTQMRYAANADDKAADYLKHAARLLQN